MREPHGRGAARAQGKPGQELMTGPGAAEGSCGAWAFVRGAGARDLAQLLANLEPRLRT